MIQATDLSGGYCSYCNEYTPDGCICDRCAAELDEWYYRTEYMKYLESIRKYEK